MFRLFNFAPLFLLLLLILFMVMMMHACMSALKLLLDVHLLLTVEQHWQIDKKCSQEYVAKMAKITRCLSVRGTLHYSNTSVRGMLIDSNTRICSTGSMH